MTGVLAALSRFTRSPAFKFFSIAILILLLLIPQAIVYGLVVERELRAREVRNEVGRIWGPEQYVNGPFLVVPYSVRVETVQGDKRTEQFVERRALFTPEKLDVAGSVEAKTLQRSIFEVPVYATNLKLTGRFAAPRINDVTGDAVTVRWRDAQFVIGISGVSGLKSTAVLKIAGANDVEFSPSLGIPAAQSSGIHARLAGAGETISNGTEGDLRAFEFSVELAVNGSQSLDFAPVAKTTSVSLTSAWPHPSFNGAFLPDDRTVSAEGFSAAWKVPHLARSVPEAWSDGEAGIERFAPYKFGVQLIAPVDFYSLVDRATKYGLLFLVMAFMAVFCLELGTKTPVHPVQYLFTGLALVFFYVLLLSLAEHLGFAAAYLIASTATGAMLAVYIGAVMHSVARGLIMLAVFAVTYLLLYVILQLEDYALLAGALLGFVTMTIVMFATLRVDWSGRHGSLAEPAE